MLIRGPGLLRQGSRASPALPDPSQILGTDLLGWWDAERADLVTQSGGLVSHWLDIVAAYDLKQATSGNKPVYDPASFNNRPGITTDGTDDRLRTANQPFPSGATPSEIWLLCDQLRAYPGAHGDTLVSYGSNSVSTAQREIERINGATKSNVVFQVASTQSQIASVDFTGRHVLRGIYGATAYSGEIDGLASTPTTQTPATGTDNFTVADRPFDNQVAKATYNTILVTNPITDPAKVAAVYAYLNARKA